MQVPSFTSQTTPVVTVDNSATVSRGFSTEVRSDVPPVQQGEGVRYTQGRPSDNETYVGLFNSRKKSDPAQIADAGSASSDVPESIGEPVGNKSSNAQPEVQAGGSDGAKENAATEGDAGKTGKGASLTLSPEDEALVEQLRKRDNEVRLHELAHQSSGGRFAGAANYEYRMGPDGKSYAVSGEVSVDVGSDENPRATIEKARQVRAAALAPAQPSAQDRQVAQEAEQLIADAEETLRQQAQAKSLAEEKKFQQTLEQKKSADDSEKTTTVPESATVGTTVKVSAPSDSKAQGAADVNTASSAGKTDSSKQEGDSQTSDKKEKMTAKEALEKILIGGQTLAEKANAAGYVRPDAPKGDSGILDLVI